MPDPLFHRSKSFLAVIDVQKVFVDKLAPEARDPLSGRICWLIGTARRLGVPILAMAEDLARNGPPLPEITAALGADVPVHDKRVFGLADQPDILTAARAFHRPQAVLAGFETDVCVAQSALGLLAAGFRVAVVADATGSPGDCHRAGLDRMRDAGVVVTTVKGIFYEWVRDLDTLAAVRPDLEKLPEGLTL